MKTPPNPSPIDTGKIPLISVAGMIKLVKLAASITPAARPKDALMILEEIFFTRKTLVAPKTFMVAKKSPPKIANHRRSRSLRNSMISNQYDMADEKLNALLIFSLKICCLALIFSLNTSVIQQLYSFGAA
jgi:hypothetical protein